MNALSWFISGLQSGTARAAEFLISTSSVAEAVAGVVDSINRHAGVLNEEVLHGAGFHFDGSQPTCSETRRRGDEPALLHGTRLKLDEARLSRLRQVLQGGRQAGEDRGAARRWCFSDVILLRGAVSASVYEINQNPLVIFFLTELWLLAGQAINLSHEHVI